ncbi:MAG TPA: energy-coupling factor transporter transmembrane component T [Thermomicrobiales bacterium]|nr:energy-coupling factor transporter transmembrane component T [Thermomicrobiales bacterium]
MINPLAWLLWFVGVSSVPVISRNPFYLALDLLVVLVVYLSLPRTSGAARAWRMFALVGSTLALLSVGFNVLTVHVGDKVFATLPDALPIVGGNLTWNAFVYGALSALAIATLLVAAATFNTAVRQGDVIRLVPGSFAGLGIAGSIAMTMVPQTIAAGRDIYDAQRSRGHRFRGLRDAGSLIVPLLGSGLERAVTLSEALEARGFGASVAIAEPPTTRRLPLLGAVGLLALSLLAIASGRLAVGLALMAGAVAFGLRATPPRNRRTRFRTLEWNAASLAVAGSGLAVVVTFAGLLTLTGSTLSYDPFPRLTMPPFEPLAGSALLLLLAPIFWPEP